MIGWVIVGVIVGGAIVVLGLAEMTSWMTAGKWVADESEQLDSGLQGLGRTLGLHGGDNRVMFGDLVHRLDGQYNGLDVHLEVQVGRSVSYTRVTIRFPHTLDQDLMILIERTPGLRNWLLRQREVEIDSAEFDRDFVLLARHEERLKSLLSAPIRFQLRRLYNLVDSLEISDETIFAVAHDVTEAAQVARLLRKSIEMAERMYATAVQLGPSPSKKRSVYTRGATDGYSRDEESSSEGDAFSTSSGQSLSSAVDAAG